MSDELDQSGGEETSASSAGKTGSTAAQKLEAPRVVQPIDFRLISAKDMFGKKKEYYKMKPKKVASVDCQLCHLLYDYTGTCEHY